MKSFKEYLNVEAAPTTHNNYVIPDVATLAELDKIYNNTTNNQKKELSHWLRNMRLFANIIL
mgnify:CR=1 FL=1